MRRARYLILAVAAAAALTAATPGAVATNSGGTTTASVSQEIPLQTPVQRKPPTYSATEWDGSQAARDAIHGYLVAQGMEPRTDVSPDGNLVIHMGLMPTTLPHGHFAVLGPAWGSVTQYAELTLWSSQQFNEQFEQ